MMPAETSDALASQRSLLGEAPRIVTKGEGGDRPNLVSVVDASAALEAQRISNRTGMFRWAGGDLAYWRRTGRGDSRSARAKQEQYIGCVGRLNDLAERF